jgi:hypothetical protein
MWLICDNDSYNYDFNTHKSDLITKLMTVISTRRVWFWHVWVWLRHARVWFTLLEFQLDTCDFITNQQKKKGQLWMNIQKQSLQNYFLLPMNGVNMKYWFRNFQKKFFYRFSGRIRTFYRRKTDLYEKKNSVALPSAVCRLPSAVISWLSTWKFCPPDFWKMLSS